MKIIDCKQGTQEWHSHRQNHYNASDAPAMLGLSKYKTRSALVKQYATSIFDESVDEGTQRLFDEGHRAEALARPLAEKIVGEDLYPCVGTEGKLSASFDGLTMDESIAFEHKSLNDSLRDAFANCVIPAMYCAQMEQQLIISGADKCLFMASKWDGDELVEELHDWYESDPNMRNAIMQGWTQFAIDVQNYTDGGGEYIPAPAKATPTLDLPAVSLNVSGGLRVISNLGLFHEALKKFIAQIPKEPSDDQEFADCTDAVKKLKAAEDALDAGEASAMAQITSIDEMRRMKKLVFETSRTTRLAVEKMVNERDVTVKRQIVDEAKDAINAHVETLNKRLGKHYMPGIESKFAEVMKFKKTFASMREAVNNELVRVKIESSAIADKIEINLKTLREHAGADYAFLFNDTPSLVMKDNEALEAIVKNRITEHKAAESAKVEAQRIAIQAEADRKAQESIAKAKAEQESAHAAEIARAEAAARLKAQQEAEAQRTADAKVQAEERAKLEAELASKPVFAAEQAQNDVMTKTTTRRTFKTVDKVAEASKPQFTSKYVITALMKELNITHGEACDIIIRIADELAVAA